MIDHTSGNTPAHHSSPAKRILVVDDDATLRGTIAECLELEGCSIAEAANGAEALDAVTAAAIAGAPFDMILLDHNMPVMDGSAFVAAYRDWCRDHPGPHARIVCVTAAANATQWCQQVQADGCLPKPFDLDHLLACIEAPLHIH